MFTDVATGSVDFDNYGGRWGQQKELDRFVQGYAVEKAKIEARKKGHSVTEQQLEDGSIKVVVQVGGGLPQLELLDQQAGHDCLAGTWIVRRQETQPGLGQHSLVDRLDLVGQRADAGEADRELSVVRVREPDAGRLDQETQPVGVDGSDVRAFRWRGASELGRFLFRNHRLFQRAIRQANATLVSGAERAHLFEHNRLVDVSRQSDPLPDRHLSLFVGHNTGRNALGKEAQNSRFYRTRPQLSTSQWESGIPVSSTPDPQPYFAESVMTRKPAQFGQPLREKRIAMWFSLRKFAKLAGVSPTYLSQVEPGNNDPPTAECVTRMAELLEENPDEWIALAGRVPDDLAEIIQRQPTKFADHLLEANGPTAEQLRKLTQQSRKLKDKG